MFQISKATGAQNNMRLESVSRDTVFTQKSIVVYITKFYKFRGNSKSGNVIMFPWLKKKIMKMDGIIHTIYYHILF